MSNSGISGDLFLGALLDLIDNPNKIIAELIDLKKYLSGVNKLNITLNQKEVNGINVSKLDIDLNEEKDHRHASDLKDSLNKFLDDKEYSKDAKEYAKNVLNSLIRAEAKVHKNLEENIHLHELSSVDTLIDILGVTKALEILGYFERNLFIYASKVPLGGGTIKAAHGDLPIPAPATSKIVKNSNLIVYPGPIDQELTTPTGAALLANLNPKITRPHFHLKKDSYSTGEKQFTNFPNIFRLYIGQQKSEIEQDQYLLQYNETVSVIETNIDDVSGEIIGDFIDLVENKALDIQVIHTLTKKNRPSYIIKILCHPDKKFELIEFTMEHLGTLGVRYYDLKRICIDREIRTINITIDKNSYSVDYKLSFIIRKGQKKIINIKPEFDNLKKISDKTKYSIKALKKIILPKIYDEIYNKGE